MKSVPGGRPPSPPPPPSGRDALADVLRALYYVLPSIAIKCTLETPVSKSSIRHCEHLVLLWMYLRCHRSHERTTNKFSPVPNHPARAQYNTSMTHGTFTLHLAGTVHARPM